MRTAILWIAAGLALLGADGVSAGTLYRCDSPDGTRSYTNKRVRGASCQAVASYARQPASNWQPVASASAASIKPESVTAPSAAPQPASASPAAEARPATATVSSTPGGGRRVTGQIYTYTVNGVTYSTNQRPQGVAAAAIRTTPYSFIETCYACGSQPGVNFGRLRLNTNAYQAEIAEASRKHGVDEAIIRAIMHAESAYNPNALSRAGAQGLMQLMPATARRFGVTNAFEPRQNIDGGVRYLAWLLRRFNGDLTLASAGYNAGEGAVDKYKGVPPYNETRRYVERVRLLADRYRAERR
ncbi:transglycosylase [Lysobacteraceae bacterium NML08-0793]|nr:transglycosylase [Xanthomonadaceae bacterium NML08-0793]